VQPEPNGRPGLRRQIHQRRAVRRFVSVPGCLRVPLSVEPTESRSAAKIAAPNRNWLRADWLPENPEFSAERGIMCEEQFPRANRS
jgi:hypothetical protein